MAQQTSLFAPTASLRGQPLAKSDRLLRVFEDIHNHIYANEGLSSEQSFAEMMKVLALKVCDEKGHGAREFFILPEEFAGKAAVLKDFEKRMHALQIRAARFLPDGLAGDQKVSLRLSSLAYAVDRLQHIDLLKSSRDIKGLAFQKFVCSEHRRGRGQFFTPEQVVDLCVRFLRPTVSDRILDLACGTGGFLSQAVRFVIENSSDGDRRRFLQDGGRNVFGIEINPMVARTAQVRLALEETPACRIVVADALSDWPSLDHEINRVASENHSYEGYFDIILTNPPFGSQGRIINHAILDRFDLGHKWVLKDGRYHKDAELQPGQVPDVLFIERCLDFLKIGGRMAIVLPNGDLENSSAAHIRQYILSRARVLAIVHLPFDTFVPFGTGVKASVLFLEKTTPSKSGAGQAKVFFGNVNKLGYQANKNGSAVYQKAKNGQVLLSNSGEPMIDEDTNPLIESYSRFLKTHRADETDNCFSLPAEQVRDRFDLEYHKPSQRGLETQLLRKGARPLHEVATMLKRRSPKLAQPDQEVLYIELADINVDYCEINGGTVITVHELPSRASFELQEGDIITAIAGNSIGTKSHMSAMVTKEFAGAVCTNGFRILRPREYLNPYYLLYYLRTEYFLRQVFRYRTGAAIPAISDEDMEKILIYVPPKRTQDAIADKVMESFTLRQKSKQLMQSIKFELA